MAEQVLLKNGVLSYELVRKRVKNVNLHIRSDGEVWVSAPPRVSKKEVEKFLLEKEDWILSHQARMLQRQERRKINQEKEATCTVEQMQKCFEQVYARFEKHLTEKPTLTIRMMKSRWGSCHPQKKKVTLNKLLLWTDLDSIEYVLIHEFVHFFHPNHSSAFYACLVEWLPDYKVRKERLKSELIL